MSHNKPIAYHDPLTDIANRMLLLDRLNMVILLDIFPELQTGSNYKSDLPLGRKESSKLLIRMEP